MYYSIIADFTDFHTLLLTGTLYNFTQLYLVQTLRFTEGICQWQHSGHSSSLLDTGALPTQRWDTQVLVSTAACAPASWHTKRSCVLRLAEKRQSQEAAA